MSTKFPGCEIVRRRYRPIILFVGQNSSLIVASVDRTGGFVAYLSYLIRRVRTSHVGLSTASVGYTCDLFHESRCSNPHRVIISVCVPTVLRLRSMRYVYFIYLMLRSFGRCTKQVYPLP